MQIVTYLNYKKIHIIDCHLVMKNRCQTQEHEATTYYLIGIVPLIFCGRL